MKKRLSKIHKQYTIRNVPDRLDQQLREASVRYGTSLNDAAIEAMSRGLGLTGQVEENHDLDDLIGTWIKDTAFDKAVKAMNQVDPELWK